QRDDPRCKPACRSGPDLPWPFEQGVASLAADSLRPLLSIGLPVYNGVAFLAQALDCLLTQTFSAYELIVSDNASTDGTAELCRQYAARDARIRYIRNDRNVG